jgi:hypothetical protein
VAHEGFKGIRLGISSFSVTGSQVLVDVQFVDNDGFVHATTRHALSIGEHELIQKNVKTLLETLVDHISGIHFARPDLPLEQGETARGIAEALSGPTTDLTGDPEAEG